MKKKLIAEIRVILDFMEDFDTLAAKAREKGDEEREDDLHAALSSAESRLRESVGLLLGDRQGQRDTQDKTPF